MSFLKFLGRMIPADFRHRSKIYLRYLPLDILNTLRGKRTDLVPPLRMIFTGDQDFVEVGNEFLGHFRNLGHLQPHHSVLDIGSGIGRMARPLTGFLDPVSRYEGFDIVESGVAWCAKNITPRHPNFNFQICDVYNELYRPSGRTPSSEYVFPYPDAAFDFIFATSVFTHMFPTDIRRYMTEISRVMKPGGRALLTFLLWNEESARLVAAGKSSLPLFAFKDVWTSSESVPEEAIAVSESFVSALAGEVGLELETPIRYGRWCGRENALSYQDLLVFTKPG